MLVVERCSGDLNKNLLLEQFDCFVVVVCVDTSRVFGVDSKTRRRRNKYNEVRLQCLFSRLKKINKVNIRVIDSDRFWAKFFVSATSNAGQSSVKRH